MRALPIVIAAALLAAPAEASSRHRNGDPAESRYNPYSAQLPACSDPAVLAEITGEFASREAEYWRSGLTIATIDRIGEGKWRPWGRNFIPRRFCTARVILSDMRRSTVSYSVREGLGLFGWTWEVNWCLNGLDRHKTYAPECRMARP